MISYTYRHYTDEGATRFQQWAATADFSQMSEIEEVNGQLDHFMTKITAAMDLCFPTKTTRRRENDPPWINGQVRALAKKRRKIYHREGRSARWKEIRRKGIELIQKRARAYWDHQKRTLLKPDAARAFFKNVKSYNCKERPPSFHVRSLFDDDLDDSQVAEKLAEHFNGISQEFDGISPDQIPETFSCPLPPLVPEQVAARLKEIRKPKSMVKYDIFPALVAQAAPFLAGPLTEIYNTMIRTKSWPTKWKEEFVTPIPKKAVPESVNDLRNISCTALFSKVFESFVLGWLTEQVGMRQNQMGGMKGASSEHYLVNLWQEILESLEDPRAGSIVTSIDYAKAFNRLDFSHCLNALAA